MRTAMNNMHCFVFFAFVFLYFLYFIKVGLLLWLLVGSCFDYFCLDKTTSDCSGLGNIHL